MKPQPLLCGSRAASKSQGDVVVQAFLRSAGKATFFALWLVIVFSAVPALAELLSERIAYWEKSAFLCEGTKTGPFPSKETGEDPQKCDDGDMTLFNGLLCASGDDRGCEAVRLAQGPDGRWWRSPRRIGWEHPQHDVSFSPDQALGVGLYLATKKDTNAAARWYGYLDGHRTCLTKLGNDCLVNNPFPRYCPDDPDKRCWFRPNDCQMSQAVFKAVGITSPLCPQFAKDALPSFEQFVLGSATVNKLGFPLHLAGVQVFLLQKLGHRTGNVANAARILASRQPKNPFFLYLADGPTQEVTNLVITKCPSPDHPSEARHQWSWEREESERAWIGSMYWDCLFMGRLITSGK